MSRIRLILLSAVIAVFAVVATAASAQAHEYKSGGSGITGTLSLKEKVQEGKAFTFKGKPLGVSVEIRCTKLTIAKGSSSITTGGKGSGTFSFSSCATVEPSTCTAKEPIVTEVGSTLVGAAKPVEVEFAPKVAGEPFTTITLTGASCTVTEPFKVTGTQTCKLPGGEVEAAGHEVECTTAGSKLKAGGKAATFQGTLEGLELESGALWSAAF